MLHSRWCWQYHKINHNKIHLPDTRYLESGVMSKYIRWFVVTLRWTEKRTVPGLRISQQMTSESLRPPLTSLVPSGENSMCVIPPMWPRRRQRGVPFGSTYTPNTEQNTMKLTASHQCQYVDPWFMYMGLVQLWPCNQMRYKIAIAILSITVFWGHDVWPGRLLPVLQRNQLPPSSGFNGKPSIKLYSCRGQQMSEVQQIQPPFL